MGFTLELSTTDVLRPLEQNRNISRHRFLQVLTARLLVLRLFFEEARKL